MYVYSTNDYFEICGKLDIPLVNCIHQLKQSESEVQGWRDSRFCNPMMSNH